MSIVGVSAIADWPFSKMGSLASAFAGLHVLSKMRRRFCSSERARQSCGVSDPSKK